MNVCIISANQLATENPARNRLLSFIEGFLKKGYKVKLISMDDDKYFLLNHEDFEHYKTPFIDTKISSFTKRAMLEIRIAMNAINKANTLDCDLNLITIPSMFLLHMSFFLKRKNINILDIRDLSWEYLSDSSILQRVAKQVFRLSAIKNIRHFNFIAVTNDHELNYVKSICIDSLAFKMPNGVSEYIFNEISRVPRKNHNLEKITITYIGNIGLAQDLATLVSASKKLEKFQFNIVGHGTDFNRVHGLIDNNQKNIKFFGQLDFSQLKSVYQDTDILYAQLAPDFSGAMPSKLYEYLATGKHIVYGGSDVAEKVLKNFENVTVVEPQDVDQLVTALQRIKQSKAYEFYSTSNQQRVFDEFVRENSVKNFIEFVEHKVSEK